MAFAWTRSIGLALIGDGIAARVPALARAAESAGLGSLWLVEDYFFPGAYTLAGAAAAVTERIVLGLGVVNPYTRHPALIAMETASLAALAPGRVVLGLGSSNRNWIAGQMSIPFEAPLARVRESVEVVRRLLAGERLTYRGSQVAVAGVELEEKVAGAVPILLGVKGPKALSMAAEVADGVHGAILTTPAHVRRVRATAAARADFTMIAYVATAVDDDGRRARARVKPLLARYLGVLHGQSILADAGLDERATQPFRAALAAGEPAAHLVDDDLVERLAVAGTPADCRRALARFADAGLDAPIAVVPHVLDLPDQISRIGRELAPAWKELGCR
jgi:5,10-methylenetetrahydromethanopterin reductase